MKLPKSLEGISRGYTPIFIIAFVILLGLMMYRLGSLTGGLSAGEVKAAIDPVGFSGIWHNPQYLPLKLIRSIDYFIVPGHGQTLTRLPNVLFGVMTVASFGFLIWLWHGTRIAILTTLLFATSAWVLHVSRLASFDVLYLWASPMLLITQVMIYRYSDNALVWYGCMITWGLLLYVPGLFWVILAMALLQVSTLREAWREASPRRQVISMWLAAFWLPLLLVDMFRSGHFVQWLGLPSTWSSPAIVAKHFIGVFVHLFIRGPQYPDIWLGRTPILDAFTLLVSCLGIYFYARHWKAWRSRTIGTMFGIGVVLVGLAGPVGISFLVPLVYVTAAAGIAYLLHEWLKVFPLNPFARGVGIGFIALLVVVSCVYNLRSYFVAWPHNDATKAVFRNHL